MDLDFLISFEDFDEAVLNLERLQERLKIYRDLSSPCIQNSKGEVIDNLLLAYEELNIINDSLSDLIKATQNSVKNVSQSFKNADANASEIFK